MNTASLVLNGRTAASIALLPERQRSSITMISRPKLQSSYSSSSGTTTPTRRPPHKRRTSRDSPGWYITDGGMTLDDFAKRLNTTLSRIEQYQGRCAQNVVMALMGPTPLLLFIFNPVTIFLLVLIWWLLG